DQPAKGGAGIFVPGGEAAGGQPAQGHGKDQGEQHAEPEIGNGDAGLGEDHQARIGGLAAPHGGDDAQRQADQHGEHHGHHGQRQGDGHALGDQPANGDALGGGYAEIAPYHAGDPAEKALM